MRVFLHKNFEKRFVKLPSKIKEQFKVRRNLFLADPFHPQLNNHSVEHAYPGCRSINITGDYRAIFSESDDSALFVNIGTHAELYK